MKIKSAIILMSMLIIVLIGVDKGIVQGSYPYNYGVAFMCDGEVDYTPTVTKNTNSYVGMVCQSSEKSDAYYIAKVYAVGSNDSRYDASHGNRYTFYEGTSNYYMKNWVNENGYNRACIQTVGYNIEEPYGTVFSGVWYPDQN